MMPRQRKANRQTGRRTGKDMYDIIYGFTTIIAKIHEQILSINDSGGYYFDDKELHFITMGIFGMLLIFIIHPVFKLLAKTGHTMIITWVYVFTLILVLAFAIEIGQWYTGTGVMEKEDMAYGITGFLVMFLIFAIVRGTFLGIKQLVRKDDRDAGRYADGR